MFCIIRIIIILSSKKKGNRCDLKNINHISVSKVCASLFAQGVSVQRVSVQGVNVLGGMCPRGKCPGDNWPGGIYHWGLVSGMVGGGVMLLTSNHHTNTVGLPD